MDDASEARGATSERSMLDEAWVVSPSVALRPEPFGALAYHFGNRKLTFLKRPELVHTVMALDAAVDVRTALLHAGVPESQHPSYAGALRGLAAADMIRPASTETNQRLSDEDPR